MEKYIVVYGNPVDGFTHVGPFDLRTDALRYMEEEDDIYDAWVVLLQNPCWLGDEQ